MKTLVGHSTICFTWETQDFFGTEHEMETIPASRHIDCSLFAASISDHVVTLKNPSHAHVHNFQIYERQFPKEHCRILYGLFKELCWQNRQSKACNTVYQANLVPAIRPVGWGGSRGSNEPPKIFGIFWGGLKRQENLTQNNQKTVTGRLHGRLPSFPGSSEEAATFWHYNEKF